MKKFLVLFLSVIGFFQIKTPNVLKSKLTSNSFAERIKSSNIAGDSEDSHPGTDCGGWG